MRKTIAVVFVFFSYLLCDAQSNLVLNPSFEEYTNLPEHFSNNGISFCKGWYTPSFGSPDYFHKDCDTKYISIAKSVLNYKGSHSGDACMGIYPFMWNGYMEHITGELGTPLEGQKVYRVSFWIKYAGNVCGFSTDCIGVLFTNTRDFLDSMDPFYESLCLKKLNADLITKDDLFYSNDSTWIEVSFLYKAKGGEKFLTIGKFYEKKIKLKAINHYRKADVQLTNKREKFFRNKKQQRILLINNNYLFIGDKKSIPNGAYYYIDDVNVSLIEGF